MGLLQAVRVGDTGAGELTAENAELRAETEGLV